MPEPDLLPEDEHLRHLQRLHEQAMRRLDEAKREHARLLQRITLVCLTTVACHLTLFALLILVSLTSPEQRGVWPFIRGLCAGINAFLAFRAAWATPKQIILVWGMRP